MSFLRVLFSILLKKGDSSSRSKGSEGAGGCKGIYDFCPSHDFRLSWKPVLGSTETTPISLVG